MAEIQESHKITIDILKEIPSDKHISLYKLRNKTKKSMITLRKHTNFLKKLRIIEAKKKYIGKKLAYELKLTQIGKKIVKNL